MIKQIFRDKPSSLMVQLIRYVLSGGVAFVVDFGLLYLLTESAHLHYLISTIIAYTVGLIITYLLSIYWIFDERSQGKNWVVELSIFALIGVMGLGLTSLSMMLFTDVVKLHYLVSKIVTTVIVFIWNFIGKKLFLFSKSARKSAK